MIDNDDNIVAASLILIKRIGLLFRYGYAPKGFLIDYTNIDLLKEFCHLLKKRYYRKNLAFIKINPEIVIGTLKNNEIEYNDNKKIIDTLTSMSFLSPFIKEKPFLLLFLILFLVLLSTKLMLKSFI